MTRWSRRIAAVAAALAAGIASAPRTWAASVDSASAAIELAPENWRPNSPAPRDLIAALAFAFVDPIETEETKRQAAAAITPTFRFITSIGEEAVADLERDWAESRKEFQTAVAERIGPLPLDAKDLFDGAFERLRLEWNAAHPERLAPTPALARLWATESDDGSVLHPWREALRAWHTEVAIVETDAEIALGAEGGWLMPAAAREADATTGDAADRAQRFEAGRLVALHEARERFLQRFESVDPAAQLATRRVRVNTFYDDVFTARARAEHAARVTAPLREHPAGAVVIQAGTTIGPRELAALAALRAALAASAVSATPPPASEPPTQAAAATVTEAETPGTTAAGTLTSASTTVDAPPAPSLYVFSGDTFPFAFAMLGAGAGAILLAGGWLGRQWSRRSAALDKTTHGASESESPIVLALRDDAVQRLYSQRQALLDEQERSTERAAALEERVSRLHPQIQARMRLLEERIHELESELAAKAGGATTDEIASEIRRLRRESAHHIAGHDATG